jgi:hypothetical protein
MAGGGITMPIVKCGFEGCKINRDGYCQKDDYQEISLEFGSVWTEEDGVIEFLTCQDFELPEKEVLTAYENPTKSKEIG